MSTVAQNLEAVAAQKVADKAKVDASLATCITKGVTVPVGSKLGDLAGLIGNIEAVGDWSAPSDWINIGSVANNEILLLVCDVNSYIQFGVVCSGGYTVEWGDGVSNSYSSNSMATHNYTVGTGQSCTRGYTTFKIRIYATSGGVITQFYVGSNPTLYEQFNSILWAKFGTTGLTTLISAFVSTASPGNFSGMLECVELPHSLTSCTSFASAFYSCFSLEKIVMPYIYSSSNLSFSNTFINCVKLKSLKLNANSLNVSTFYGAFSSCASLRSFEFPETILNCSDFGAFNNCLSLHTIKLPTTVNSVCAFGNAFAGTKIREFVFPSTFENRITSIYQTFYQCNNLTKVVFPTLMAPVAQQLTGSFQRGTFRECFLLEEVTFPSNLTTNLTDYSNTFYNCYNLKTVNNFPVLNSVSSYSLCFSGCFSLSNISNINQLGDTTTGYDLSTTFTSAYSLTTLSIRNKITGRFVLAGVSLTYKAALTTLLFTNPGAVSTWAGTSPQIDVAYCSMEAAALNALFTSIIATSVSFSGKTIRITGNPGAETCNTTIITNAGGTVNKTT